MDREIAADMSEEEEETAAPETEVLEGPCKDTLARRRNVLAYWLYFVTLMVIAMVVIGGLTRLTNSGLSMVEWRPLTGWLPHRPPRAPLHPPLHSPIKLSTDVKSVVERSLENGKQPPSAHSALAVGEAR